LASEGTVRRKETIQDVFFVEEGNHTTEAQEYQENVQDIVVP
jgi:hypothetical protein